MNRRPMLITSAVVIGAMTVLGAWAWLQLPADARIPIHWGIDGEANGWADRTVGLFLIPALSVAMVALFWVIPRIEPRRANLERSARAYGAIWIGVILLLGGLQVLTVVSALGHTDVDVTRLVFAGTGVLFVVMGNYLPKVRPNYMVGIRTPWTLASDLAWTRTHRVGGRLFVIEGVVLFLLGLSGVDGSVLVAVLLVSIGLTIAITFAYSYFVWNSDPERRTT